MDWKSVIGMRFLPTDEELISEYLQVRLNDGMLYNDIIKELNIYDYEPYQLQGLAYKHGNKMYFFTPITKNGSRTRRLTKHGCWKASQCANQVLDKWGKEIGTKRPLVYYHNNGAKNSVKSGWLMNEYMVVDHVQELVLCEIHNKKLKEDHIADHVNNHGDGGRNEIHEVSTSSHPNLTSTTIPSPNPDSYFISQTLNSILIPPSDSNSTLNPIPIPIPPTNPNPSLVNLTSSSNSNFEPYIYQINPISSHPSNPSLSNPFPISNGNLDQQVPDPNSFPIESNLNLDTTIYEVHSIPYHPSALIPDSTYPATIRNIIANIPDYIPNYDDYEDTLERAFKRRTTERDQRE